MRQERRRRGSLAKESFVSDDSGESIRRVAPAGEGAGAGGSAPAGTSLGDALKSAARWKHRALLAEGAARAAGASARESKQTAQVENLRLRKDCDRLRGQRDDAIEEVIGLQSDLSAKQAALRDAAAYVKHLKNKLLEAEYRAAKAGAAAAAARNRRRDSDKENRPQGKTAGGGAFDVNKITEEIRKILKDAQALGEKERKSKVRALQLRFHPDKNPVLKEMATEVTKIINTCAAELKL